MRIVAIGLALGLAAVAGSATAQTAKLTETKQTTPKEKPTTAKPATAKPADTAQTGDAKVQRGQKVFADSKCTMCHSLQGKGNAKGPLDDVGTKLTAEEMRQWLINPAEMTGKTKATRKPPMPPFAKLPKEDIDALIAYLQTLKK